MTKFSQLTSLKRLKIVQTHAFIDIFQNFHKLPVICTLQALELYEFPSDARGRKLLVKTLEAAPDIRRLLVSYQLNDDRSAKLTRATAFFSLIVRSSSYTSLALGCDGDASTIASLFHRRYTEGLSSKLHSFELLDDYSVSSLFLLFEEIIQGNEITSVKKTDTFFGNYRGFPPPGFQQMVRSPWLEAHMARRFPRDNYRGHYSGESLPLHPALKGFLTDESAMCCSFVIPQLW